MYLWVYLYTKYEVLTINNMTADKDEVELKFIDASTTERFAKDEKLQKFISAQLNVEGRLTLWLTFSVLATVLGSSFIIGYNIGVINAAGGVIKRWICIHERVEPLGLINCTKYSYLAPNCSWDNLTDKDFLEELYKGDDGKLTEEGANLTAIWSLVVGMFPLGGMFGGLATSFVADRFGRKGGMLLNTILTFAGGAIMACSYLVKHYVVLVIGRFIIGINCGLNSGLAPMYLTEISPINLRGTLGSAHQLSITISILVSNIFGMEAMLGTPKLWAILLLFTIVPAIYQLCTMPLCPESPKYLLITKSRYESARNALIKLRNKSDVETEINIIQTEANEIMASPKIKFKDMFTDSLLRWALIIAIMMMLSQQLAGINATMFYSTQIFEKDAQLQTKTATYATLAMLFVNVLMTIVSTILVEKAGRKTLHLIGMIGMWISTIFLVIFLYLSSIKVIEPDGSETKELVHAWAPYMSIALVIFFVISFSIGPGSIPLFYVSELFEQGVRGKANSVAVSVLYFATSLVGFCFGPINDILTIYTFLVFTFFLTLFILFTLKYVPETKDQQPRMIMEKLRETKPF